MFASLTLCAFSMLAASPPGPPAPVLQDGDAAPEPEQPSWTGSIDAGLTKTSGNTDVTTIGLNFEAKRESTTDRFTLKAYHNSQEDETNTTADNSGASLQYDYFVSDKWYVYANSSGDRDKLADLDLRHRLGGGAGYQFRSDDRIQLSGELGISYINENFAVPAGTVPDPDESFLAVRVSGHYENKLRENITFITDMELFPSLEDSSDFTARWDNRLRVALTENMYGQVQVKYDLDNEPVEANDELDSLYMLTVGWTF